MYPLSFYWTKQPVSACGLSLVSNTPEDIRIPESEESETHTKIKTEIDGQHFSKLRRALLRAGAGSIMCRRFYARRQELLPLRGTLPLPEEILKVHG